MTQPKDPTPKPNRPLASNRAARAASTSGGRSTGDTPSSNRNRNRPGRETEEIAAADVRTPDARTRSVERREGRERDKRRQRVTRYAVIIGVIVIVAIALFLLRTAPADAPIPETVSRYEGILAIPNNDGYPRLGDPDASVQVSLISSFDCNDCRIFYDAVMDDLIVRAGAGDISLTYIPLYGVGTITNGEGAARAALCASDQNQFWQMSDAMYAWQGAYPSNQAFSQNRILTGVSNLGLDRGAYDLCVGLGQSKEVLDRASVATRALLNFTTAPALTINGVIPLDEEGARLIDPDLLIAEIDRRIAEVNDRQSPESTPEPEATAEITPESTAEDAATIEVTDENTLEATSEIAISATDAPESEVTEAAATAEAEITPEATTSP